MVNRSRPDPLATHRRILDRHGYRILLKLDLEIERGTLHRQMLRHRFGKSSRYIEDGRGELGFAEYFTALPWPNRYGTWLKYSMASGLGGRRVFWLFFMSLVYMGMRLLQLFASVEFR